MNDPVRKAVLAGLGVAAFAREKLGEVAAEVAEHGGLTGDKGKRLADTLMQRGSSTGRRLLRRALRELERLLEESPLVTRGEYRSLLERVRALESRSGAASPGPTATGPGTAVPDA